MAFDLSGWLDDDFWHITGVASEKHPDGGSYAIPSPSIRDTALLRRMEQRMDEMSAADTAAKEAADAGDDKAATDLTAKMATLMGQHTEDLKSYLGVKELSQIEGTIQEAVQRKLLGPVYDQLVEDGVSEKRLTRTYQAAVVNFTQNEQVVKLMVEFEGKAQALPNRAERRAARNSSPKAGTRSSRASSGTPARTRKPTSTRSSKTPAAKATKTA